jgi:hypothetical protein
VRARSSTEKQARRESQPPGNLGRLPGGFPFHPSLTSFEHRACSPDVPSAHPAVCRGLFISVPSPNRSIRLRSHGATCRGTYLAKAHATLPSAWAFCMRGLVNCGSAPGLRLTAGQADRQIRFDPSSFPMRLPSVGRVDSELTGPSAPREFFTSVAECLRCAKFRLGRVRDGCCPRMNASRYPVSAPDAPLAFLRDGSPVRDKGARHLPRPGGSERKWAGPRSGAVLGLLAGTCPPAVARSGS